MLRIIRWLFNSVLLWFNLQKHRNHNKVCVFHSTITVSRIESKDDYELRSKNCVISMKRMYFDADVSCTCSMHQQSACWCVNERSSSQLSPFDSIFYSNHIVKSKYKSHSYFIRHLFKQNVKLCMQKQSK